MKNRKMKTVATVAVVMLVMIGSLSFARQGPGDGYGRKDVKERGNRDRSLYQEDLNRLELTDEQKSKVEDIQLENAKESVALRNQIREKEAHLTTLITEDKANKSDIDNMIEAIGKLKTQDRINRTDTQLKIRELLTEKQKILFDQHLAARGSRGNHRGPGYGR
jgi:Spy/CpxP family protein refolding chaperone